MATKLSAALSTDKESLSQRIAELSPEKRELLDKLLRQKGIGASRVTPIPRRAAAESYPVSFAQQRLWVLHQLDPASPAYNMPESIRLGGPLDLRALEESLNEIIRRHEVLRTTFRTTDDGPVQVVAPHQKVAMTHVDLAELPPAEREARARQMAEIEALSPFDLAKGPVLRARVIRLAEEDHVVLFTVHHIASDLWSMGVLVRELMALYEAVSHDRPSPLPELPIQYADFAAWQRDWLQGHELEKQLDFWKGHLAGAPAVLELPTDRPRPAVQSFNGAIVSFDLPKQLSNDIMLMTRREGVTLFMLLLAAFNVLLSRYTGQEDIVVGTPVAGRNRAETENLMGFFVNTLALRTNLSGDPAFRDLLARVREVALGTNAHQDFPFEKLVEEIQPERSLSHSPIFQVMFALQNVRAGAPLDLPGLKLSPVGVSERVAKFDLTLFTRETNGLIDGYFEFNTDLFDPSTIERMIEHFAVLLEDAVARPEARVSSLRLLSQAEHDLLVTGLNDTRREYARDLTVDLMIERQAQKTPAAAAVTFKDRVMTYQELNERANQLARHLRATGIGPETLVGVLLRRTPELIVALVGVLKAGAAYVPIDAGYPRERLSSLLNDAGLKFLITEDLLLQTLPQTDTQIICLDRHWEHISLQQTSNLACVTLPENLAYVIFTSGSTGVPKGVMIPHRGLTNYLSWAVNEYRLNGGNGAPLHSPIGFDLTITSLFLPLIAGTAVTLVPEDDGVEGLRDALNSQQDFSLVKITPAHLEVLAHLLPPEHAAGSTRALVIGGEALFAEGLSYWFEHAPQTRLINEYGPTETVVGCCVYEVPDGALRSGPVPIGRPIANTILRVLDNHLQPVPIGVNGELYIGGDGVARGYLNSPSLTAEKFIPDPFGSQPGTRLYRTGDVARYLADGNLVYVGRVDTQVKIRGFRIELGEVETTIQQHPAVRAAVAFVCEDSRQEKRLVAYVVANEQTKLNAIELRNYLKDRLPSYMLPSSVVTLDELPLTSNGKVDYDALPKPDTWPDVRNSFVAPRNLVELQIADIWEDVLNLRPVGVTDNFFDLGGHSVLALRVTAQIEKVFGVEIPLSAFFDGGTISRLAELVLNKTHTPPRHLVPIQKGDSKRPIFFVHPIGGGVVCYAYLARRLGPDQPVYGLAALEVDDPHTQVATMAAAYLEEIRTVQPHGPYYIGGWSFGAYVAFEIARQLKQQDEEVGLLAILDSGAPHTDQRPDEDDPIDSDDPVMLARTLEGFANVKEPLPIDEDYVRQLAPDDQLLYIMEQAKKANIMPQELTLTQVKRSLQNFRSRVRAGKDFVPELYPGKVTLFKCEHIEPRNVETLQADPGWGWSDISSEPVDIHSVPGSHETMVIEPDVRVLAEKLNACIAQTEME
ncbi:MAG TPA: amino acid adenylation domain-containing protein [Pyrinomonadaceae bacterium]|jgi:amino acid adenylation domain-containing protein|nr:amino acid adenylation domain-containing protein [Pyrinomonadaceae bacterium]